MDSGELFAVGSVIVHCPPEQKCSVTELPEDHVLAAVWGTSASDVFAVGWRGLIMHFDGNSWAVQRAPAPRNRSSRGSHLFHIGAFLAGEIVAGLPAGPDAGSNTVLKWAGGVWQPVSHQEWSTLYDAHLGQPRSLGPCAHGIDLEWPGAYASGPAAAVVCRDNRRSFWKEDGRWVPHGRAKGVCNSRGASFMDSVRSGNAWIVGCHREGLEETTIWKNEGDSWSPECSIDQTVWRFIATAHSIYAVGDRIILRRSLPPRAE